MNTKQIIAELRRSAVEDANPFEGVNDYAFFEAQSFSLDRTGKRPSLRNRLGNRIRTFYLLVAEAIESE